ncbi:ankyrin repeat-containing domain protein [Chytridium lagenaria]|nr:ankyrin repeat-containing domain protein [Chytridium lagenaria]
MLKLLLYAAAAVGIGAFGLYSSHRITQARSEKQNEKQKRALFDAAIRREDFVQFRELLQRFIRLDPRDDRGNTPFMLACQHGNLEVIRYYLSMHPPSSDIQKSPLFLAANDNGHTAVHVAALSGSMETMRALLGSNSLLALAMVSVPSIGSRQTPLHLAVDNGLFPMVEALIKLRADVNAADTNGITPLMIAVKHGRIAFVERLLTVNADTNLLDKWKHSALFYACKHQEYDIARMLLEKKRQRV